MFRFFGKFLFSEELQSFKGAQAIMKVIFEHGKSGPTSSNQATNNLILSQEIRKAIQNLKDSSQISLGTANKLKGIFDPNEGIKLSDSLKIQQASRLLDALNKKGNLPISPDSHIMSFFMNHLYEKDGKLKLNPVASKVSHIVGTPGLGKSIKLIAIKYLHDLRLPYIIKNGTRKDSIFDKDYKLFYFNAHTKQKVIMEYLFKEMKNDFCSKSEDQRDKNDEEDEKAIPQIIRGIDRANKNNFREFIQASWMVYRQKGIYIRPIIDQINKIYQLEQQDRIEYNSILKEIIEQFQSPALMVSSKNNPYLEKNDPVLKTSTSSKNGVTHLKTILDNSISPKERLSYAIQCLFFQLRKKQFTNSQAIEVINFLKLPLMTHLSIARLVKTIATPQNLKLTMPEIANKISNQLYDSIHDKHQFLENLKEASQMLLKIKDKKDQKDYWLNFVTDVLSFSCKQIKEKKIISTIELLDDKNKIAKIQKNIDILVKEQQKKKLPSQFDAAKESNYFFTHTQNELQVLYSTYSILSLEFLRIEAVKYVNKKFLEQLLKANPTNSYYLIRYSAGYIFELLVCYLYYEVQNKTWKTTTKIILPSGNQFAHFLVSQQTLLKKQKGVIYRYQKSYSGNAVFDFYLEKYEQKKKKTFILVDCTISIQKVKQKMLSAKSKLLNSKSFLNLIESLISKKENYQNVEDAENVEEIEFLYYVLMARKGDDELYTEDPLKIIQIKEGQKLKQLKEQIQTQQNSEIKNKKLLQISELISWKKKFQEEKQSQKQFLAISSKIKKIQVLAGVFNQHFKVTGNNVDEKVKDLNETIEQLLRQHTEAHQSNQ